ncbi:MAG TPA: 30S ribosomal protein S7 [Chloroflexi bacterium]|jgi:small subunit ribosomal protein S7|nr:30S ribosomal protein S7 [Chloroflexota bacterium]
MRRTKPEKREVVPDIRYNNVEVSMIINRIMWNGKKSVATRLVYDAFDIIEQKTGKNPVEVFDQALTNVGPVMEVRPRRIGGSTYQVPMEVPVERRRTLAMRWLITASRARNGKSFSEKLAAELMDASDNQGASVRRKEEAHRMAEANRAFSHFRV